MREFSPNHYERAFENWLIDHRIKHVHIDEHERDTLARGSVKNFDFLVYPRDGRIVMVEVKGRKFRGASLEKMTGFECWVTAEDVAGLSTWRNTFRPEYEAIFVFAYKIELFDVDCDGRDVLECGPDRYVFFCIKLDDYRANMKRRSPKWKTVTLPAQKFRECAIDIGDFLL